MTNPTQALYNAARSWLVTSAPRPISTQAAADLSMYGVRCQMDSAYPTKWVGFKADFSDSTDRTPAEQMFGRKTGLHMHTTTHPAWMAFLDGACQVCGEQSGR